MLKEFNLFSIPIAKKVHFFFFLSEDLLEVSFWVSGSRKSWKALVSSKLFLLAVALALVLALVLVLDSAAISAAWSRLETSSTFPIALLVFWSAAWLLTTLTFALETWFLLLLLLLRDVLLLSASEMESN